MSIATIMNVSNDFLVTKITEIKKLAEINEYTIPTSGWGDSSVIAGAENLIPLSEGTQEINGVTFTTFRNGTIVANGSAPAGQPSYLDITFNVPNGTYSHYGCPQDNEWAYWCGFYDTGNQYAPLDRGPGITFEVTSGKITYRAIVGQGATANNIVFRPIIVSGSTIPTGDISVITEAEAEKYPKFAKVTTDKYDSNFIPQYIDFVPSGNFFTEDEKSSQEVMAETIIFADDGFYAFAEEVPSVDIHLRIGGVK